MEKVAELKKLEELIGCELPRQAEVNPDFIADFASKLIDGVLAKAGRVEHKDSCLKIISTTEVIDRFLASKKHSLRSDSIKTYGETLRPFGYAYPELPTEPEPIEEYLAKFNSKKTTAQHKFNVLRAFYNWVSDRFGVPNPMKKIAKPTGEADEVKPLDKQQAKVLLDTTKTIRLEGLVDLFLGHAFRLSEALRLNVEDIGEDRIRIHGKRRTEWFPLLSETREVLLKLASGRSQKEPVFIGQRGRLSRSQVQLDIKQLFQRAGITTVKQSPHTLRHTFATLVRQAGCDRDSVSQLMRHKNESITDRYIHLDLVDELKEKLERYSPLRILENRQETLSKKPDCAD